MQTTALACGRQEVIVFYTQIQEEQTVDPN